MNGLPLALGVAAGLTAAGFRRRGSRAGERIYLHLDDVMQSAKFKGLIEQSGLDKKKVFSLILKSMSQMDPEAKEPEHIALLLAQEYLLAGEQAFVVGPRMQAMFDATGLPRVTSDTLKLPFKAFWVALPDCRYRLWSKRQGWHEVRGLYLDERKDGWEIMALAPTGRDVQFSATFFGFFPGESGEIKDYEVELERMVVENMKAKNEPDDVIVEVLETHKFLMRVLINLLLYLQSNGADLAKDPTFLAQLARKKEIDQELRRTKKPKKTRLLQRELQKLSGATVVWLGRRVEQAGPIETVSDASGRRRMRLHWVRGHWKLPMAKKERKLTWVMPYERGEGRERVTGRTYKVR